MHYLEVIHGVAQQNLRNTPTNLRDRVAQQAEYKEHKERKTQ